MKGCCVRFKPAARWARTKLELRGENVAIARTSQQNVIVRVARLGEQAERSPSRHVRPEDKRETSKFLLV